MSAWLMPMQCKSARWAVRSRDSCRSLLRNDGLSLIWGSCCLGGTGKSPAEVLYGYQDKQTSQLDTIAQMVCQNQFTGYTLRTVGHGVWTRI